MQYCCPNNLGCIFWGDYSGVRIDRLSSLCVFFGIYPVHSALYRRTNEINNTVYLEYTEYVFFGDYFGAKIVCRHQNVSLSCVQTIPSIRSQVTSARTIPFSEYTLFWLP